MNKNVLLFTNITNINPPSCLPPSPAFALRPAAWSPRWRPRWPRRPRRRPAARLAPRSVGFLFPNWLCSPNGVGYSCRLAVLSLKLCTMNVWLVFDVRQGAEWIYTLAVWMCCGPTQGEGLWQFWDLGRFGRCKIDGQIYTSDVTMHPPSSYNSVFDRFSFGFQTSMVDIKYAGPCNSALREVQVSAIWQLKLLHDIARTHKPKNW